MLPPHQVNRDIAAMPPAPSSDGRTELSLRLLRLGKALVSAVEARDDDNRFYRAVAQHYSALKVAVLDARPVFEVLQPDDDESEAPAGEESDLYWLASIDDKRANAITLEQVRELAEEFKGRELPNFVPYRTLEKLVEKHKGCWHDTTMECLESVNKELNTLLDGLVAEQFGNFAAVEGAIR